MRWKREEKPGYARYTVQEGDVSAAITHKMAGESSLVLERGNVVLYFDWPMSQFKVLKKMFHLGNALIENFPRIEIED